MIRVFLFLSAHLVLILLFSCNQDKKQYTFFSSHQVIDTIPFSSDPKSNIFSVMVMVQEKPFSRVFDTGATKTILHSKIPTKIIKGDTVYFYNIFFQPLPSVKALIDTLQIGKIKIIDKDSYLQRDLNFDGIIGQDIIGEFIWKFDLINRKAYVAESIPNINRKFENNNNNKNAILKIIMYIFIRLYWNQRGYF